MCMLGATEAGLRGSIPWHLGRHRNLKYIAAHGHWLEGKVLQRNSLICLLFRLGNSLSVPDVSRERRCLQTSREQLMATKEKKKTENLKFRPREAWEFLGRWNKGSNTIKTQRFHTSGVCLRGGGKNWTIILIFGICP